MDGNKYSTDYEAPNPDAVYDADHDVFGDEANHGVSHYHALALFHLTLFNSSIKKEREETICSLY